jgi:hypothetical protein
VAPFTIDGDIAIDPTVILSTPALEAVLTDAGFTLGSQPGSWSRVVSVGGRDVKVDVDFMVPEAAAPGEGTRGVDLLGHSRKATRRVPGLEAALVDHGVLEIAAFEPADLRKISLEVAGPGALVIAKVHKIADRVASARGARTQVDKDAGDIYRLMQATDVPEMVACFQAAMHADVSRPATEFAVEQLGELFGRSGSQGVEMAIRAIGVGGEAPDTIRSVATAYASALLRGL